MHSHTRRISPSFQDPKMLSTLVEYQNFKRKPSFDRGAPPIFSIWPDRTYAYRLMVASDLMTDRHGTRVDDVAQIFISLNIHYSSAQFIKVYGQDTDMASGVVYIVILDPYHTNI